MNGGPNLRNLTSLKLRGWLRMDRPRLPDFIIIGAQKGGTSSLYAYLNEHPQVIGATKKEVHYFDRNFSQGENWYRSHFPTNAARAERETECQQPVVTGEATPYYLFHPSVAERMGTLVPEARLIVLLRNPVDRALSHYHHAVRLGFEPLTLEEAIEEESTRLVGEEDKLLSSAEYRSFAHQELSYLARGLYLDQLKRFDTYDSRGQIIVLKSEELFQDPQQSYDQVLRFLGLAPWALTDVHPRNTGTYARQDSPVIERLNAYFEPHNQALYDYLGVDMGW